MTVLFFFFNDTATTEIYTLSLHDALPIFRLAEKDGDGAGGREREGVRGGEEDGGGLGPRGDEALRLPDGNHPRSEEHTSELQSRQYLVCRLLLEKKKKICYIRRQNDELHR